MTHPIGCSPGKGGSSSPLFSLRLPSWPLLPLLAAVLLALSAVNPDHFPPWTSFHNEAPAFAASALLLVAAVAQRGTLQIGPPLALLLALVGIAWLQFATGLVVYAGDAWLVTAYLGAFGAAWTWGRAAAGSEHPQLPLALVCVTLVGMGVLASWQALAQWLDVLDSFQGWVFDGVITRPAGNLGQPNHTATLLLMASVAVAIFLARGQLARLAAWSLLLLFLVTAALTQSRTALVSATVIAALLLAASLRFAALRRFRVDIACWLLLFFFLFWLVSAVDLGVGLGARDDQPTKVGPRLLIWRQMLAAIQDSPWAGFGWLQVSTAQQSVGPLVPGDIQFNFAHNLVLDLLVMLGLPLGLLVLGLTVAWLLSRLQWAWRVRPVAALALFPLVPFAVHLQLELPHAYAYFLVPAGVLLGAFDFQTQGQRAAAVAAPRWASHLLAGTWCLLLAALAYEYAMVEEDFRVNRFENRRLGQTPDGYEAPQLRMLTQWGETLQAMRLRARPGMSPEDLAVLQRASNRYTWAPLHFRTALALGLNGKPREAEQRLRVLKALFSAEVYAEGRASWIEMSERTYPQLKAVQLP